MRRTRVVRRLNYKAAAFYMWVLAMVVFVATNAAVKIAALKAAGGAL